MLQVYIWGAGSCVRQVIGEIDQTKVKIQGILDQDEKKQGIKLFSCIPVISPEEVIGKKFDYLIISIKKYELIESECVKLGIPCEKVISYWKEKPDDNIFVKRAKRVEELIEENRVLQCRLDSAPYEWGLNTSPHILDGRILLEKIIKDHSSLCRFGDGEFEMIRKRNRPWFQEASITLSKRLKEVLLSQNEAINIAIAQNFTEFDKYKEDAADEIRSYMFGNTRKDILDMIDMNRYYYDTYVTRPYMIYKDKKNADEIFPLFKKIWNGRDVVIIEGEYSRIGVGNDLMKNVHSISRILCPSKNAWNKYEEILSIALKEISLKALICISLGPSATVLAYDLARKGYQALDIGQLDNEYEWYLRGARDRVEVSGKMIAEFAGRQNLEMVGAQEYREQIIARII